MTNATLRLAGKIAIVTGAAQGMGASHAQVFVEHGAKVVISDVLEEQGRALAAKLGPAARFVHHDVTKAADWDRVVKEAESAFGPVNVLVNNAGIFDMKPIEEMSEDAYRRVIDVNQVSCFFGMKAVAASMRRAGGGSIINVSSVAGLAAAANMLSYVASKFAVRGMTKVAALEFGKDGIRVNSLHPGAISTPMTAGVPDPKAQPIRRLGQPVETSMMVVFLASDESSFCTGAEYVVDGGYLTMVGEVVI